MRDPDGGSDADSGVPDYEGASVGQVFEFFSATAPKGWRVELIEGEICVTSLGDGGHATVLSELTGQVIDRCNDPSLRNYTGIGLNVPGDPETGHVIPDLVIAPKGSFRNEEEWHDPSAVLLVAEVTSDSTAVRDREKKIRGYARAGIPVYLLIDRQEAEVTVYSEPSGDEYAQGPKHKLGLAVPLPEPLGFELDTGEF
ncbi:Uma2 family endonuclease [Streptomyces sp. NBC_00457]|uniref:Uma2 family endonuclease n=1 Tax=unclassified Streptomyces TaxID=2593676 RepID=UPI002E2093DF|nr:MULTISPECIES: Uma2 family endonuclease [unclassified Streptomyces]